MRRRINTNAIKDLVESFDIISIDKCCLIMETFRKKKNKGIAVHTMIIVALIVLGLIAFFAILTPVLNVENCETSIANCASQQVDFCNKWYINDPSFTSSPPSDPVGQNCVVDEDGSRNIVSCRALTSEECRELLSI